MIRQGAQSGRRARRPGATRWAPVLLVPILGALPCDVAARQSTGVDGTIRGQVLDARSGVGLSGALVEFLDPRDRIRQRTTADAEGHFALTRLRPGPFSLRVTHPGYLRTQTPHWWVESGEMLDVTIRVDPDVIPLAPLEVTARARTHSPVLSGFHERLQRRTTGMFITRDEIAEQNAVRITDLLEPLPGVTVDRAEGRAEARTVVMARSLPGIGGGGRGDGSCPVQVYVDGVLATRGGGASPDELASPLDLEGIEVYRGLSGVPAEFLTPEARCGVIALWTQRRR